jgi:hypothetical protein
MTDLLAKIPKVCWVHAVSFPGADLLHWGSALWILPFAWLGTALSRCSVFPSLATPSHLTFSFRLQPPSELGIHIDPLRVAIVCTKAKVLQQISSASNPVRSSLVPSTSVHVAVIQVNRRTQHWFSYNKINFTTWVCNPERILMRVTMIMIRIATV